MTEMNEGQPLRWTEGQPVYDLVGVGFGPANLALAALIEEQRDDGTIPPLESVFLERRDQFAWHPNMLIDGARIQLSFLKDLVTLRDPRSRFSFLCYLWERGRLEDFVNLREFFPTRLEFNDYYRWVAAQVSHQTRFGREVRSVEPVRGPDGDVELVQVTAEDSSGTTETYLTRHLVFAPGGRPHVPEGVELDGRRVFHCRDFLGTLDAHYPDRDAEYRFVVVGSGQSAAEVFQHVYQRYPKARVTAALRRYAYKPADESQFVNEIFHSETVDFLYELPEALRDKVIDEHYDTNYSAVDLGLIREIYIELYDRHVRGENHVELRKLHELTGVDRRDDGVVAHFHDLTKDRPVSLEADAVILATGFRRDGQPELLAPLSPYLETTPGGRYSITRDYRIRAVPDFRPGVFLQGFCESTHGLSDTLLSVLPLRAQEILDAMLAQGPAGRMDSPDEVLSLAETAETRG